MMNIFGWANALIILIASAISIGLHAVPARAADQIRFALDWKALAYYAPLFVARERGYYEEEDLDVSLTYGNGAAQAFAQTGAGVFDVALGDITTGLAAYSQGAPLKLISTYGAKSIIAYIGLDSAAIKSPKDLEGKTLGGPPSDTGIVLLPAFANVAQFDASKVKVLNIDAGARVPALFQNRIDLMVSYDGGSLQVVEQEARKLGKNLSILRWPDYGFNALGIGVWANANFLAKKTDVIERFLHALGRAVQFTIHNPDKAAEIYSNIAGTLDPDATREAVRSFARSFDDPSQDKGLGYIDPAKLDTTYNLAVKFMGMEEFDLDSAFTNEAVEKVPVKP